MKRDSAHYADLAVSNRWDAIMAALNAAQDYNDAISRIRKAEGFRITPATLVTDEDAQLQTLELIARNCLVTATECLGLQNHHQLKEALRIVNRALARGVDPTECQLYQILGLVQTRIPAAYSGYFRNRCSHYNGFQKFVPRPKRPRF